MKEKAAAGLLALGLLQIAGDVLGIPALKGLALATAASPAPRVFTSFGGFEPFSTRFFLEWRGRSGALHSLELTPQVYARLRGAYNRRNAYGAVLAGGPVLSTDLRTAEMWEAVLSHAACDAAPLLRELDVDLSDVAEGPWIRYEPRPGGPEADVPTVLRPSCR